MILFVNAVNEYINVTIFLSITSSKFLIGITANRNFFPLLTKLKFKIGRILSGKFNLYPRGTP